MNIGDIVLIEFIELRQEFQTVGRSRLLEKLDKFGIKGTAVA